MSEATKSTFVTMPLTVVLNAAPEKLVYIVGVHPAATMFPMMPLRKATKQQTTASGNPEDPKLIRRAYKLFMAEYQKMRRSIDMAATGCGGPNDFTQRARDCLQVAQRAMHECLMQHGKQDGSRDRS